MNNVIEIQDAYIATVSGMKQSDRNYDVNSAKAWKKATLALREIGLGGREIEVTMWEAHDMVKLNWNAGK
jgi:hypothetical protein